MSATVYGDVTFGVTEETGLYTQSFSADIQTDKAEVKNGQGSDVGGSVYNASATISINGTIRDNGLFGHSVGAEVSLANTVGFGTYIEGYTSGGDFISRGIRFGRENEGFHNVEAEVEFKPWYT
jgi:hypothetical protein